LASSYLSIRGGVGINMAALLSELAVFYIGVQNQDLAMTQAATFAAIPTIGR